MSNLNFLNTDNCNDVGVDTPTQDLTFVDYILKNKIKDFTNVRKYTVTYSTNCKDELSVDIPPNYNLNVEIESCALVVGDGDYVFKLTGINPDFVSTIEACDPTYTTCFSDAGIIKTSTYILFGSLGNIAASPTTLYFKVNTIDGFEYRISFVLTQAGITNCDYTLGSFTSIYDLPAIIEQPTYGGKYATTGIVGLQIGPDIVVEIVADNVGTVGNIAITTDGISNLDFWVNDWNTSNPTNTVTLTYIEGANWIGAGEVFTLSDGVNPTIPDNLQLSLNTLYSLSVLYPALYGVKICEVDVNDNDICLENNQFIDCQTAECVDSDLCDSTEDICNLTSQVKKQYQSIIYGIDCCGEAKQKILKHYIRIVCPDELNC